MWDRAVRSLIGGLPHFVQELFLCSDLCFLPELCCRYPCAWTCTLLILNLIPLPWLPGFTLDLLQVCCLVTGLWLTVVFISGSLLYSTVWVMLAMHTLSMRKQPLSALWSSASGSPCLTEEIAPAVFWHRTTSHGHQGAGLRREEEEVLHVWGSPESRAGHCWSKSSSIFHSCV